MRIQHSGFPILELTTGLNINSQHIVGEILQDTERQLAAPVPWSTHKTHFLPQAIPFVLLDPP